MLNIGWDPASATPGSEHLHCADVIRDSLHKSKMVQAMRKHLKIWLKAEKMWLMAMQQPEGHDSVMLVCVHIPVPAQSNQDF